ncbi:hypothetical protein A2473_03540 [candidate division WWE3 bacterium RIFOXYC2_FULL_42_13]|uniref:Ppx-GppA, Ppx/GppA phosphatase family protein n=2 Tax=Katanobacteria TaxID=422282 RepID=A0A0G1EIE2_UNCKA|nr:MAG: Ppx-GppA, Ppx/GppA phosphatase family protein [candidate division WWE3 bacterium GW2011_GWB2_43_22]OGC58655.1 MAG: hypothetical protein A2245_00285 [candidate division WWE3 bacterium RIFOXYA2_FULL_43_12]OGC65647.1 MAG: hypothetical protein A2274_02915 [candidate division WWE3 bacterium RIFOXYA12_FULL_43_11]OGC71559.1 MAG: hypothetical protein A2337_01755 [candidate division WWE3 bacterium RIFOXYB2_FULL_43_9]OGC72651.1 MAG: hypothetical protein A2473_03540 [candidate division WWE3 bacter
MDYLLLDIGSSTIKPYLYRKKKLLPLKQLSVHFKKNFANGNIDVNDADTLVKFIKSLKKEHPGIVVKTYATSVFRDIEDKFKSQLIERFYSETQVLLNIIDQTTENIYLQIALVDRFRTKKNILLVNIGGGSTQLLIINNNLPVERKNISLGVGTIIEQYPEINNDISGVDISKVLKYIIGKLPKINSKTDTAFYTGGELTYMKKAKYKLNKNSLFSDDKHPSIIKLKDFTKDNIRIFNNTPLAKLESLVPENPKWMLGARPCSALAQAIFKTYGIKTIIPSNSNLIDGIVRHEL